MNEYDKKRRDGFKSQILENVRIKVDAINLVVPNVFLVFLPVYS